MMQFENYAENFHTRLNEQIAEYQRKKGLTSLNSRELKSNRHSIDDQRISQLGLLNALATSMNEATQQGRYQRILELVFEAERCIFFMLYGAGKKKFTTGDQTYEIKPVTRGKLRELLTTLHQEYSQRWINAEPRELEENHVRFNDISSRIAGMIREYQENRPESSRTTDRETQLATLEEFSEYLNQAEVLPNIKYVLLINLLHFLVSVGYIGCKFTIEGENLLTNRRVDSLPFFSSEDPSARLLTQAGLFAKEIINGIGQSRQTSTGSSEDQPEETSESSTASEEDCSKLQRVRGSVLKTLVKKLTEYLVSEGLIPMPFQQRLWHSEPDFGDGRPGQEKMTQSLVI